ncbi:hypothetical protein HJTV-2_gp53 [Haloarcula virus HJTV-2]|uniref:Uncharacterized protein n=2 Tax=Haloferacalesvirus TaxID=2843389 RepID=A0AAE8XVR1_9CAUD|nr:hypothetical protein M1M33_gp094 [Haloarcula virus HJTV-2]UBF21290.1 hypothetical protein HRTV-13_gp44 [Halorubrum phage HRTV-13]UBF21410.1 hypothetical protein HRTV-21_gp44 [Halorubrum virus HRTV-21]UBF21533.1 hypothetical protein HRTV-24_gp47 [Halorubrum virus HRTV-24]UBF21673.1 hypothetical protein HJTV-2_gp53 [Haloarcula virus HJTV-2]
MSEDGNRRELQKACREDGCGRHVGREHDYCLKHRED